MIYIRVAWKHQHRDEPVEIFSELDDARWEIRKVEVFGDGSLGFASRLRSSRSDTFLGLAPIPSLAKIAVNPEFEAAEISRDEFEDIWLRAAGN